MHKRLLKSLRIVSPVSNELEAVLRDQDSTATCKLIKSVSSAASAKIPSSRSYFSSEEKLPTLC